MIKFNDKRGYRKFVNERDQALEVILRNSRLRMTEKMNITFRNVLQSIGAKYNGLMQRPSRLELNQLENQIEQHFEHLAFLMWMDVIDMRKKAYMLAYAGEAQAISQVLAKTPKLSLDRTRLDEKSNKVLQGQKVMPMRKFLVRFGKLRREIISAIEYSLLMGEDQEAALGRVFMCLPKQYSLPKKKVLKTVKITEANHKPKFSTYGPGDESSGFEMQVDRAAPVHGFEWDQETWNKIIDDLGSDHIMTDRSPASYVDIRNPYNDLKIRDEIPEEDKIYSWEIEKDVVHDFVEEVRKGQVDAANKQGIKDFVWIAILDDRTDDCCEWRSGLLTSEIEAKLKSEHKDDDCREVVPPAHFNCRCTLAPASDELEAVDNEDTEREFSEWLEQK